MLLTTNVVNGIICLTTFIVMLTHIIVKEVACMPLLNKLKEYRARFNMNQTELSVLAGVSRQTISLIERGDYSPSVTLALKIAKIFGTTVEEIFSYEEDII